MSQFFDPSGQLDISTDASDLPDNGVVRRKNLCSDQSGKVRTRDGSTKLNTTALDTVVWWIEEQSGNRYEFAGASIYENESSIASGLTDAQWSAFQYNSFNDTSNNIFALNGTDRKRISNSTVYEWGIDAPTQKPTLGVGAGSGLTGQYNAVYTFGRKVGSTLVAESNPSDPADLNQTLDNQSLSVSVDIAPSDAQITHIFLYRSLKGGSIYYLDQEIAVSGTYAYGYMFDWEESDSYISGNGFNFTVPDSTHSTENTHTWEETFEDAEDTAEQVNNAYYSNINSGTYKNGIYWILD